MSGDGTPTPTNDPSPSNAGPSYSEDDIKRIVGEALAERDKASPPSSSGSSVSSHAPATSSTNPDLRALINSVFDERESRSKQESDSTALNEKVAELEKAVKKLRNRAFSIFD